MDTNRRGPTALYKPCCQSHADLSCCASQASAASPLLVPSAQVHCGCPRSRQFFRPIPCCWLFNSHAIRTSAICGTHTVKASDTVALRIQCHTTQGMPAPWERADCITNSPRPEQPVATAGQRRDPRSGGWRAPDSALSPRRHACAVEARAAQHRRRKRRRRVASAPADGAVHGGGGEADHVRS